MEPACLVVFSEGSNRKLSNLRWDTCRLQECRVEFGIVGEAKGEGGAQFDQLCDVMWNCALFAV